MGPKKNENRKKFPKSAVTTEGKDIKNCAKGKLIERRNEFKAIISYQYLDILAIKHFYRVGLAKIREKNSEKAKHGCNGYIQI